MKNKLVVCSLLFLSITGCVTVNNVTPSSSPTSSPVASNTPIPTATPFTSVGFLQGKFTIGPLCPFEPCNISDENKKNAYDARKIQIYTTDLKTLIKEFQADYKTETYKTELPSGKYMLNITNAGLPGTFQPKEILITANNITTLDLDIDTGIR